MTPAIYAKLIKFLQEELYLSQDSLAIAQRHVDRESGHLPMILWQYGLVTIEELDKIFDWLEAR